MNFVTIVGRIVTHVEKNEMDGKSVSAVIVSVERPFEDENGEHKRDNIKCVLWNGIADNLCEYCQKGDVIGVKGRLQVDNHDDIVDTYVVAEKVTFLSSKKNDEV